MSGRPPPDPAILELFRAELETHLATLNAGLLSLERAADDLAQLEALMRAAHSIKGAANIVGLPDAVQVSHHMEDCFVAAQRGQLTLTSDSVDVLLRGVDALARLGASVGQAEADSGLTPAAVEQLVADIATVRRGPTPTAAPAGGEAKRPAGKRKTRKGPAATAAPAETPAASAATPGAAPPPSAEHGAGVELPGGRPPAVTAKASQAAVYEFVSEAKEHLADVVQDLLALEQRPGEADAERVGRLFRAMHSVKGGAGLVGCQVIEELAHAMENVLEEPRQTGIAPDSAVIDVLLAGTDRILTLVDDAERSNEANVGNLVQRLRQCLAQPPAAEPTSTAESSPSAAVSARAPADAGPPPSATPAAGVAAAPAAASAAAGGDAPRGPDRAATVRIPVPLVDRLMTLAGELVLVRNQALRSIDAGEAAIRPVLQRLDALTSQLQGAVTQTRMQPVGNLFAKFPRTVRDLARQMGKTIELEVSGTEVEMDKSVLELLSDPLTHLIRNCCDHGLESPAERAQAGKPAAGRVILNARQQGGQICIEVRDDGRGIDPERIRRKALESGLRTAAELARLSDKEALGLITLPGFSTATVVTDLSGRGVGMDVVKTNLDQLGGTLEIDSTPGHGTTFSLRVPLTLAIIPCLMVRAGEQRYAIPQKDLEELVCLHPQQTQTRIESTLDQEVVRLRDQLLPLVRLAEVLDRPRPFDVEAREAIVRKYHPPAPPSHSRRAAGPQPMRCCRTGQESVQDYSKLADNWCRAALPGRPDSPEGPSYEGGQDRADGAGPTAESVDGKSPTAEPTAATFFAVVKVGARRCGLVVDEILKNEEIVVKPMHSLLKPLACFSGATILGDGRVALILNMEGIVQHAGVRFGTRVEQRVSTTGAGHAEATPALLFCYGPHEQFAVPLAMIRRLVMIDPERIERVGEREFIVVDGVTTPLLRLDQVLPVSAGSDANPLFLLLPKNIGRPAGFLATSIIDTETLPAGMSRTAFQADGVVGSALIRGRVTLLLDLCRLAELSDPARRSRSAGSARHLKKRVLAVDDTEFFRELVRGYLEAEGYDVVTASDGSEAVRNLEAGRFDLVVSDIEMPVMDGWTLARTVRQHPQHARLPLLALTTLSSDEDRARAQSCGFDGYEVKVDRQRFLGAVAQLLGKGEAASTT
jgi:two-component system chemotaxis sensor kinase CheA